MAPEDWTIYEDPPDYDNSMYDYFLQHRASGLVHVANTGTGQTSCGHSVTRGEEKWDCGPEWSGTDQYGWITCKVCKAAEWDEEQYSDPYGGFSVSPWVPEAESS